MDESGINPADQPSGGDEAGSAHDGTTTLPSTPFETFVFGRGIAGRHGHGHHGDRLGARPLAGRQAR